jgi:hypothetical protein
MYKSLLILFLLPIFMKHNNTSHKLLYKCLAHDVMRRARQFSHSYLSYRCKCIVNPDNNIRVLKGGGDGDDDKLPPKILRLKGGGPISDIEFLQLNCNRSVAVYDLLQKTAQDMSADILIVSEPNRNL